MTEIYCYDTIQKKKKKRRTTIPQQLEQKSHFRKLIRMKKQWEKEELIQRNFNKVNS